MSAVAEQFEIKQAERRQARLRLALAGSSGGGKTASSLLLARGIVEEELSSGRAAGTLEGKVGLIDTERRSAQLYAHLCPFSVIELDPPYTIERYIGAMDALERAGVLVMVVDSISHAWAGDGGVLSILDRIDDSKKWRAFRTDVNPVQDKFIDRILRASCHMIVTMRSKTAWVVEQVEKNGRTVSAPRRIGMAPVQRPGIEFEFTTLLDLDSQTHKARAVKNRCPVFKDGEEVLLTAEVGRALAQWMQEGAPAPAEPVSGTPEERARSVAEVGCRSCAQAETVPDLARVFTEATKAVQAFKSVLPAEVLRPLIWDLEAVKDCCKAALGGDAGAGPDGSGDALAPDVVASIEHLLQQGGLTIEGLLGALQVKTLRSLDPARVQEAVRWIYEGTDLDLIMPPALRALKVTFRDSHFDDMPDDIPF